ncbi:MAG TPA: vWA domain-containing protein [Polyangiaceae bacterium]|nr:vWA domain-containing protein [Polyangiaceae bacterium]
MRAWLILPFLAWAVNACSASSESFSGGGGFVAGSTSAGSGSGTVPAGVLTAGAWDDNRNYDFFKTYLDTKITLAGAPPIAQADRDSAAALFAGARAPRQRLDVAIVIDTTGSMGDEASYLRTEFQNISAAIAADFPGADQHWALVAYRDVGDTYVTLPFDFTADLGAFQASLGGLSADGGGDYPESPDLGLAAMNSLHWRPDADVARVAFWVADAPAHDDRGPALAKDFADSRQRDVHLYPVAASGADDLLELSMRSAAQLTGGRYLFLTDDSGIGDTHKVPEIPCYFVTKLANAIVRMVSIELSGIYREPDPSEILRTGGDPKNGSCTLSSGQQVSVF